VPYREIVWPGAGDSLVLAPAIENEMGINIKTRQDFF